MATIPATLSEPILVAKLPLPCDLAARLECYWDSCHFSASERPAVEEDFRLRHHYAGHFIVATAGPPGLQIHAIDPENPDEVDELTRRLYAQGYRHVLCLFPTPWDDPNDQVVTLNDDS